MSRPRLLGAVLAGGRSRRFGSDKARAALGAQRLVEHAAASIGPVCERTVVVSSLDGHDFPPLETLADTRPDEGPLGALEAALTLAASLELSGVFAIACDMPLDPDVARTLAAHFDGSRAVSAKKTVPPHFEPLCAVYPVGARSEATRLLDEGERAARALFPIGPGLVVDVGPVPNINTPEELAAFASAARP